MGDVPELSAAPYVSFVPFDIGPIAYCGKAESNPDCDEYLRVHVEKDKLVIWSTKSVKRMGYPIHRLGMDVTINKYGEARGTLECGCVVGKKCLQNILGALEFAWEIAPDEGKSALEANLKIVDDVLSLRLPGAMNSIKFSSYSCAD